jgi:hypothetical protein
MRPSPEMTRYITTGRCPYCDVEILSADYLGKKGSQLKFDAALLSSQAPSTMIINARLRRLVPSGVKARLLGPWENWQIQCLTCSKTWPMSAADFPRVVRPRPSDSQSFPRPGRPSRPQPSTSAHIDLTGCQLTGVKAEREIERPLYSERRQYPNNSSEATLTKEVSISNSVTLSVTTESSHVKAHNAEAGFTILGFAAIQAQVQHELSQLYSVMMETTLTISEKTTIEIPPSCTVEHVIHWMEVSWGGIALLGKPQSFSSPRTIPADFSPALRESMTFPSSQNLAEVPYRIPLRLAYSEELNDVPGAQASSQGS